MEEWYPHLRPAFKFCQEAIEKHQEYGDSYDAWWTDCEERNPLNCVHGICQQRKSWLMQNYNPLFESRNYLIQSTDYYLKSANDTIGDLISNGMPAWKRILLMKQMDFPASEDDLRENGFEKKYECAGVFAANIKQLISQIWTLLMSNQRFIEENDGNVCFRQTSEGCLRSKFSETIHQVKEQNTLVINLIKLIVSHALVVTVQPCDPIKQKKNFHTEVTLLKCGQYSEDVKSIVQVQVVKIGTEKGKKICKVTGSLLNNIAHIAVDEDNSKNIKRITANFPSIKIESVETRKEGKNAETLAVEKHYALFYKIENLNCRDIGRVTVHTYSEYFSYMVHSNQNCSASAMAFWKVVLFAQGGNVDWNPTEDSEVLWPFFEVALKHFFCKTLEVHASQGLLDNHVQNISNKLLGHLPTATDRISYQQVAKQPLMDCYTFWEWFYEAMQLIKKDAVLQLWKKAFVDHLAPFNAVSLLTLPLHETIDCDMMNGINFLESFGMSAVPKKDILNVLKKGLKPKEVQPVVSSSYRPWSRQFKWDQNQQEQSMEDTGKAFIQIPQLPQMQQHFQVPYQADQYPNYNYPIPLPSPASVPQAIPQPDSPDTFGEQGAQGGNFFDYRLNYQQQPKKQRTSSSHMSEQEPILFPVQPTSAPLNNPYDISYITQQIQFDMQHGQQQAFDNQHFDVGDQILSANEAINPLGPLSPSSIFEDAMDFVNDDNADSLGVLKIR